MYMAVNCVSGCSYAYILVYMSPVEFGHMPKNATILVNNLC